MRGQFSLRAWLLTCQPHSNWWPQPHEYVIITIPLHVSLVSRLLCYFTSLYHGSDSVHRIGFSAVLLIQPTGKHTMVLYLLIILKAPNAAWQLYFSTFFFFLLFQTTMPPCLFLLKPSTLLLLTHPHLRNLIFISQITLKKNLCNFPMPQPPTYLTLVPIFLPSFPHPCSCRGQIFSLYIRSHTSYLLRDVNPLTIFTSLSCIFNFPFPQDHFYHHMNMPFSLLK